MFRKINIEPNDDQMDLSVPFENKPDDGSVSGIEALPLEERIRIAQAFNPLDDFKRGWFIDKIDTRAQWCAAAIWRISGKDNQAVVNYDGWSTTYNEVFIILSIEYKSS